MVALMLTILAMFTPIAPGITTSWTITTAQTINLNPSATPDMSQVIFLP